MIKGFFAALISAVVLFAAGGITAALFGTKDLEYTEAVEQLEWNGDGFGTLNETFTGEKTWYFGELADVRHIAVSSSSVKTYIAPSTNGRLSVSAQSNDWKEMSVKATYTDGVLDISVGGREFGSFVFNAGNLGTVIISVPDMIYDSLTLDVGSGTLEAIGIAAEKNEFDVGSGHFEYEQKLGFTADMLTLDMGSGSVKISNAAAEQYYILMGSGSFDISGLTGTGKIDVGSGSGTAEFAEIDRSNVFDLGSGKLTVYIPGDTRADLYTYIGSGVVTVDCGGVSQRVNDDRHITLGGGSNDVVTLTADLGSGKVELLDSSGYKKPGMFGDFPNTFPSDIAVIDEATVIGEQYNNSGAEYIGEVTFAESKAYKPYLEYATTTETILY